MTLIPLLYLVFMKKLRSFSESEVIKLMKTIIVLFPAS